MKGNNDSGKKVSHSNSDHIAATETGAQARREEQDINGLYQTPDLERTPVASQIDNAGALILETTRTEQGDEMNAYWKTAAAVSDEMREIPGPDEDVYEGKTLATEERMRGEQKERERQREKAIAAAEAGIDRAARCRNEVEADAAVAHADFEARAASAGQGADPAEPDVRERLDAEDLAAVNAQARKLEQKVANAPKRSAISRMLAEKVDAGKGMMAAVIETKEELQEESGCPQPIETLEPWMAEYELSVTVQGEVTTLWEPASVNQQQVGIIEDEHGGTIKLTIWENSMQTTVLHEGDTVRLTAAKVGWYNGRPTVAADSETNIQILERGDGPAPIHGLQYQVEFDTDGASGSIDEEEDEEVTRLPNKRYRRVSKDEDLDVVMEKEFWVNTKTVFPEVSWMSEAWKNSERVERRPVE
ncbi:hypothetical protein [Halorussus sp. AFM4]|uniref:hypothetical protein n=1 Tax=Halorussus sp. AFM4 TaxID=3421651 RepID=UPI003EBAB068